MGNWYSKKDESDEEDEEDEEEDEPMETDDGEHRRPAKSSRQPTGGDYADDNNTDEDNRTWIILLPINGDYVDDNNTDEDDDNNKDEDDDSGSVTHVNGQDDDAVADADDDGDDEASKAPDPPADKALKCGQKSDLNAPKRAMSAYNCFVKQKMAERGGKGKKKTGAKTRRMETLADQWSEMSDEDRAPYVKAAAEDKRRYNTEKAKYESDKKQVIKRPVNGYIVFMREFRKKNKGSYTDAKELVRAGSRAWKRLSRNKKQPYNAESLHDSDRYAQEMYYYCDKFVLPGKADTRFSKKERAESETAAAQRNAPSEMDASDAKELKEWLKKASPTPSSSSSSKGRRHRKSS